MSSDHHRRVLIVDDDPDIRNLLVTVLRRKALLVDVATGGDEAIDLLLWSSPAPIAPRSRNSTRAAFTAS